MQRFRIRIGPASGQLAPRRAETAGETPGDLGKGQRIDRPALDRDPRLVERAGQSQAHVGVEDRLRRLSDRVDSAPHSGERALREGKTMPGEIAQRIERRLGIARPPERAREIARLVPQPPALLGEERAEQPQQRAPAFHLPPEIVHGLGIRPRRVFDRRARIGKNGPGDRPQSLAGRHPRSQGGLVAHGEPLHRPSERRSPDEAQRNPGSRAHGQVPHCASLHAGYAANRPP